MFIPRFSIRWLLGLTTFCAGVSFILSYAVRGRPWALGMTAGLWCLVIVAFLYVSSFLVAWMLDQVFAASRAQSVGAGGGLDKPDEPFGPVTVAGQPATTDPPAMTG